tara:strand:+ start:65 stop:901 length:837 start_codon:yes stop_codon:yes gene_type:complete
MSTDVNPAQATPSETPKATPSEAASTPPAVEASADKVEPAKASEGASESKETKAPEMSLDQILDMHLKGKEFETENHKGVDYAKTIEALPEDAKKLIQNLRSDYSRKTGEISKAKRLLEMREQTLLSSNTEEKLKAAANLPEDLDLYHPDGLKKYIEAKAAEQLQSLLQPARDKMAVDMRRNQVGEFKKQHTDFDSYKADITKLVTKGMKIEDAYFLLKGRAAQAEHSKMNEELEAYKKGAREAGFKVTTGRNTITTKPKFASAWEAYEWRKKQVVKP